MKTQSQKYLIVPLVILCLFSCRALVNRFSFFPDKKYSRAQNQLPNYVRITNFQTIDGLKLQALYFSRKQSDKIVLYFHGNAGNMFHRINEGSRLFRMGTDVLIVSYRGYANSEGHPSEKGIYNDAESAIMFSTNVLGYHITNVIAYGRSIGTTAAINAAQNKPISRLLLVTPLSTGNDLVDAMGLGTLKKIAGNPFDSLSKVPKIKSPILIIHGDKDEVIPYPLGLKLYKAIPNRKYFVTIPHGGHNDLEYVSPALFWSSVSNFIMKK